MSMLRLFSLLCLTLWWAQPALAEQPFSVNASAPAGDTESQMNAVAGMKYRAVVEWLQRYLGNRYAQVEKEVTPEFAERYILDYKVGRDPNNRALLQVTGHIDTDSLKRWARVVETKSDGGGSLKPIFILSSAVPGYPCQPGDTSARVRDSKLAQSLLVLAESALQRFNLRLTPYDGAGLGIQQPPRTDAELKALREQAAARGHNSAVWVHLTPCNKACNGVRLNTYLYNLAQNRLALLRSDDLGLGVSDFGNAERVRNALKAPTHQFQTEVDEAVSGGTLFSGARRIVVEGIDSYRSYQAVEGELPRLDYLTQCVLKRSEPKIAEFEVLTNLSPEDLFQRLQKEDFPGFHLKPVRVDSQSLVVRYSK